MFEEKAMKKFIFVNENETTKQKKQFGNLQIN